MRTIFKYQLKPEIGQPHISIVMPKGAQFRKAGMQYDEMFVWYEVDTNAKSSEEKTFLILETGHAIPDDKKWMFLETVFMSEGYQFVWHIYVKAEN